MQDIEHPQKIATLQVKAPFGQTLWLALMLITIVWTIGEGIIRYLVFNSVTHTPYVGTWTPEFDIKINRLDALKAKVGQIDCIFLGSSMMDWGLNPEAFTTTYHDETGKNIVCFNFGLPTLTAGPAATVAELLISRYHPKLLVYGVTARDYSNITGGATKPLVWDSWINYTLGKFSIQGWLAEHSYFYRSLQYLYNSINPGYDTVSFRLENQVNSLGFIEIKEVSEHKINQVLFSDFKFFYKDYEGLEKLVTLRTRETPILMIEVPVNPKFFPYYIEGGEPAYNEAFLNPMENYLAEKDIPFWLTQHSIAENIPHDGWKDRLHLNKAGADIFSSALAQRLAAEIQSGNIEDPFNNTMK